MEAEGLTDGRIQLIVAPLLGFSRPVYEEFDRFIGLLSNSKELLWRKRDEFPIRVGITFEEAQSLSDELLLVRYDVLGETRPIDPPTGRYDGGPREIRSTGTAWDELPKVEAELLSDGCFALTLGRGELAIFANCVDVAIEELKAKSSRVGRSEFITRTSIEPEDAEAFRDELRRLDREVRGGR